MTSNQQLDLDAIEARANAATPGPWCTDSWEIYQGTEYVAGAEWIGETCRGRVDGLAQDRADAAFVAASRTDVPQLVAEVRRLRAERDQFADRVDTLTAVAKGNKRHVQEMFLELQKAQAEINRSRARTLTQAEHNRAWHAVEGAAGEEGADPGTVLNAVLRALDLKPPTAPAARSAAV